MVPVARAAQVVPAAQAGKRMHLARAVAAVVEAAAADVPASADRRSVHSQTEC